MKKEGNFAKSEYKLLLGLLKVIPIILAILNCANTICWFFGINLEVLSYFAGCSILPMIFLYLSSIVFRFCRYHRIFLHYTTTNTILNIIDYNCEINFDILIYLSLIGIMLLSTIYFYIKEKRDVKRTEKCLT